MTTLLKYVQDILSSMDSDEVNSIGDTVEATQVATIVEHCYQDILTELELPTEYLLFQLDASVDITKPTQMSIPSNIENLEWVKYNCVTLSDTNQNYQSIKYLSQKDFLYLTNEFDSSQSNVGTANYLSNGINIPILYRNDTNPTYYTTFNDGIIIFDSYLNTVDSTLQSSKTIAYGKKTRLFELVDSFVPFTEYKYESLLFNKSKALAFAELKQITHADAAKATRRAMIKTQPAKRAVPHNEKYYSFIEGYGRKI